MLTEIVDLDWTPGPLLQALDEIGLTAGARAVATATRGRTVVNESHPDGPPKHTVWEGPIRFLTPEEVSQVASELRALGSPNLSRAAATCAELDRKRIGVQAANYLAGGLLELTAFYGRAAASGEAVTMWWD